MNVVIFGCGRTGATLALQLAHEHSVTIIEQNPEALRRLGYRHNCQVVIGSGIDEDVLVRSGIEKADAFFAVTRGDNSNIMAAQIARMKFKVKHVCVKVADPHRAQAYRDLGYFCITSSVVLAGYMRDWINEQPLQPIDAYNVMPKELEI